MNSMDLIRKFEGLRLDVYLDTGGVPTVGWGHVVQPRDRLSLGERISEGRADLLLDKDLAEARRTVKRLVRVPLSGEQRAALESFAYNIGADQLAGSTFLVLLNNGELRAAAAEMGKWIHDNGRVVEGLRRRRAEEARLLLGPLAQQPAPPEAPVPELLRRGARGPAVAELQERLAGLGLMARPRGPAQGIFGPATDQAVRRFQAAHGLTVDGIWGPESAAALQLMGAGKDGGQ